MGTCFEKSYACPGMWQYAVSVGFIASWQSNVPVLQQAQKDLGFPAWLGLLGGHSQNLKVKVMASRSGVSDQEK